ncbi:MAG: FAD-dependent oxidoreductase [Pseudomonadota bacterium]
MSKTAIIGGGVAGLACAKALTQAGRRVVVFDKGRGPGGRLSTRRTDVGAFDHGAQYFTVRDDVFREQVRQWIDSGVVAEWTGAFATVDGGRISPDEGGPPRYVGAPKMNAFIAAEAETAGVRFGVRVARIIEDAGAWALADEAGGDLGRFEAVVLATPAEQTVDLAPAGDAGAALAARAAAARSAPCWAVLAAFDGDIGAPFDAAKISQGPLSWIASDAAKPGRAPGARWVLHASAEWSKTHLEADKDDIAPQLLEVFFKAAGVAPRAPVFLAAHRWRYALVERADGGVFVWDAAAGLGACGDWLAAPRIEAAWLSGRGLAKAMSG